MAQTISELIQLGMDPSKTLTDPEKDRLEICEGIIKKGLSTFFEVGGALAEISDRRLYKESHETFELYCKDVWDLDKSSIYRRIKGYRTVKLIEDGMLPMGDISDEDPKIKRIILPENERQTRPLTRLKDPDDQVKAWGIVLQMLNENPDQKLTASIISKAVKEVQGGAVQRKIQETKEDVDKTKLVTRQFQNQYQILLDIVVASKNNGWKDCKQKAVVKHLQALVDIAQSED